MAKSQIFVPFFYIKTSVAKAMKVLRKLGCRHQVLLFGQVSEIVEYVVVIFNS